MSCQQNVLFNKMNIKDMKVWPVSFFSLCICKKQTFIGLRMMSISQWASHFSQNQIDGNII